MKTSILKKVLFVIMLFVCHSSLAHDFEVNGIYYGISIFNKNTAYVTHRGTGYNDYKEYSGSVVIPVSVTYNGKSYTVASIGGYAFYGCDELTSVTIPGTVNTINQNAFNGCTGLMDIECRATTPPALGDNAFTSYTATLKVPSTSLSAYKSAEVWKYFKYFGEEDGNEDVPTDNSGLYYNIISPTEVEVIAGREKYSGDLVIPRETTIAGNKYTVTKIGNNAFDNCVELTSVEIPNTVKIIGNRSFIFCKGLSSVVIPNSVTKIGENAFTGCNNLTSIAIGNSVANIDGYAFVECDKLSAVYITNLEAWCKIDFVYASSNPLTYAKNLYLNNEEITNLEIPNTVTTIKKFTFYGCSDLTGITIPSTVTNIEIFAFSGCTGLTSVTSLNPIPPTCGDFVFDSVNTQNVPLTVPSESVSAYKVADTWKDFGTITGIGGGQGTNIGDVVEYEGLTYKVISETEVEVIAGESKYTGDVIIPSQIAIEDKLYTVTSIGDHAFSGCEGLTSVMIGISVTSIENAAFYGCTGLTSVTIPNSVTTIGSYAFYGCDALTNIVIPNTVTSIGSSAFYNTGWYNNQPTGILYLDKYCLGYKGMVPTGTLTLKGDTRLIADSAFSGCEGLTSVTIPNSVTSIGSGAFYGCDGLTNVTIPESVTSIELGAFENCDGLTSVTIGNSVTIIGNQVFNDCDALTSVTIPESVTHIGYYAFGRCDVLISIVVESGNTVYDSRDNCNAIIETATNTLITGCKTTIIPNSVTSIGDGAFIGCHGLTRVTIPNPVTSIGVGAFAYCDGLTSVTSLNPIPPTCGDFVFDSVNTQNVPLTVPSESVSAYKVADTWKDFGTIVGGANISIGANMSGVEDVRGNDVTEPIEYYNLNGVRVQNPGKGVYIKRQGGKVVKTVRSEE